MKTVSSILSRKGPVFNVVSPDTPVLHTIQLMSCENCDFVVVKTDNFYLGILTEADYTRKVVMKNLNADKLKAKDIMNTNLPIVHLGESIEKCMKLMDQFHFHQLPVFDDMTFIGVITMDDIIREAVFNHDIFDDVSLV